MLEWLLLLFCFLVFFFLRFLSFLACRSSQVRGGIRAAAASLHHSHSHSHSRSEPHLWPTLQLWQHWILNPWAKPGIEPESSQTLCWVLNPLSHNGNSSALFLELLDKTIFLKIMETIICKFFEWEVSFSKFLFQLVILIPASSLKKLKVKSLFLWFVSRYLASLLCVIKYIPRGLSTFTDFSFHVNYYPFMFILNNSWFMQKEKSYL